MNSNKLGYVFGVISILVISIGLCMGIYAIGRTLLRGIVTDTTWAVIVGVGTVGLFLFFLSLVRNVWLTNRDT